MPSILKKQIRNEFFHSLRLGLERPKHDGVIVVVTYTHVRLHVTATLVVTSLVNKNNKIRIAVNTASRIQHEYHPS
jgi:hypothetical protein